MNNIKNEISYNIEYYLSVYKYLHQNPELSLKEKRTSKHLAEKFKELGLNVNENIGGYGVVGIFKNGNGKFIMLRTDMDALPVKEKTNLSYSSEKKDKLDGKEVNVMHACGHDIHMTIILGTLKTLINNKDMWTGTLMVIAQPAEEMNIGAMSMLNDGLFEKFVKPEICLSIHVSPSLPTGKIGYCSGPAMGGITNIDIEVIGKGGHGAYPHKTIDPIVLASKIILAFQTIISRNIAPAEPAVISVGSISGGAKHNVIPDKVKLQITTRYYSENVRDTLLNGIKKVCENFACAEGLDETDYPKITFPEDELPPMINDVQLTNEIVEILKSEIGEDDVIKINPEMGGEDFAHYGRTEEKIPICMLRIGTVSKKNYKESITQKTVLPPLHSPFYAPEPKGSIESGINALTIATVRLFNK